jgi:thiol-disulfide isomerase/thioredoxin
MSETFTLKIPLDYPAPSFQLKDVVSEKLIRFDDVKGEKGTVVVFICNHCPYVIHSITTLVKLAKEFQPKGIGFVAINANDIVAYPEDAPDLMKEFAIKNSFSFPYLYDETQRTAIAYRAACTPDYSLFDADDLCIYRGQLDYSRPKNKKPNDGRSLRTAFEILLSGERTIANQIPSSGCNIKWKKENESHLKPLF